MEEKISIESLFNEVDNIIDKVNTGEEFIVRDLFRGFEWNRIPKGLRTKLGSMVLDYSINSGKDRLKPIGKTQQNQQKYIKL